MTELECSDTSTPHRGVYGRRKRQTLQRIAGLKASLQSLVLSPSTAIDHSIAVPIPSLAVSAASISPEHPKAYLHSLAKAHHDVEVLTKQNHMLIEQCEALRLHREDPSQQQVALCPREEQEELHQIVDAAVALLRTVATCYPALLSETAQRLVVGEDGEGSPLGPEEAADELCAGLWRLEKLLPALATGHQTPLPDLAAEAMEIASALQVDHQEDGQRLLQLVGALGRAIENDRERAAEREATLQRSEERVNELNEVIHNQTQASTDATEAEEDRASRVSLADALSSLEGLREQLRNEEARAQALSTQRDEAEQIVSQASDRLAEAKAACEREKTAAVAAEAALQNLQQELLESRESAAGAAAMREEMLTLSRRVAQAQEQLESTERDRLAAEDYGMERQRRYDELHMALKRLHTVLLAVAEASTSSQDVDQKGSSEEWPAEVSDLVAVACGLRQSMAELRRKAIDAQATGTGLLSLRPDVVEGMQRETLVLYQENARYRQQLEHLLGAIESQSVEGDEDS